MSVPPFCLFSCMRTHTVCTRTSTRVARYTFLPVVSHYSTDPQVAVMPKETQQCVNKGREEEDCQLVNVDVVGCRI